MKKPRGPLKNQQKATAGSVLLIPIPFKRRGKVLWLVMCVTQDVWRGKSGPYDRVSETERERIWHGERGLKGGGGGGLGGQGEREGRTREVLGHVTEIALQGEGRWIAYKIFAPGFITRTLSLSLSLSPPFLFLFGWLLSFFTAGWDGGGGGGEYLPWCFMCMWGIYPGVLCVCGVFTLVFYVYVGYLPWCFMCMCHAWSFMSKRLKKYIHRSVPEQYFILSYIHYGSVSGQ